jgi:ubiquinol-cytochrome c reductase iron-sulfur subunit
MQDKDKTRRKVLIGLTSAVGLSGLPFAATPFIAAWNPSAKAKAAGAPVKLDVSKMQFGNPDKPTALVKPIKTFLLVLSLSCI